MQFSCTWPGEKCHRKPLSHLEMLPDPERIQLYEGVTLGWVWRGRVSLLLPPLPPFLPSSPHICVPAVTSEALFLLGKSV